MSTFKILAGLSLCMHSVPLFAGVTISADASHRNFGLMFENRSIAKGLTTNSGKANIYGNSQNFDLGLAYEFEGSSSVFADSIEAITNFAYSPLHFGVDNRFDMFNLDAGVRLNKSGFFTQLSVGLERIDYHSRSGSSLIPSKDVTWQLPSLGFGFGYGLNLGSSIKAELFYRGRISLASSSYETTGESYSIANGVVLEQGNEIFQVRFRQIESHEIGLGLRFSL